MTMMMESQDILFYLRTSSKLLRKIINSKNTKKEQFLKSREFLQNNKKLPSQLPPFLTPFVFHFVKVRLHNN